MGLRVDLALTPAAAVGGHVSDMPWGALAPRRCWSCSASSRASAGAREAWSSSTTPTAVPRCSWATSSKRDDQYTGEHSRGVVELALDVGERLSLDADRLRNLEFGALLHDVGKVAIPKEIINKPGKLDAREWEIIKTHTVRRSAHARPSRRLHERRRPDRPLAPRALGRRRIPDGLPGETIPIEARIISCCDTWSAMTTDRSYRAALPTRPRHEELRSCAGTQLDPQVVAAALAVVEPEFGEDRIRRHDRRPRRVRRGGCDRRRWSWRSALDRRSEK